MKKTFLIIPVIALSLFSCKKEKVVQVTDDVNYSAVASGTELLSEDQLGTLMARVHRVEEGYAMDDLNYDEEYDLSNNRLATQMTAIYMNPAGDYYNVSIADFGNMPSTAINHYLAGKYIPVGTDVKFPIPTKLAIAASPNEGYILKQGTGKGPIRLALDNIQNNQYAGLFAEPLAPLNGSFVKATTFASTVGANVAGWEAYDNATDAGMMILLVNNRYAVTIDGTAVDNSIVTLYDIAAQLDFSTFPQ